MMKVLFISSQFPNSMQPNLGIFSLNIVREMASQVDIRVVAPVPSVGIFRVIDKIKKYKTDPSIPLVETIEGITVYHPRYFAPPGMGFTHRFTMASALEPLIETIDDQWSIDVVNCHWLFPDGVAACAIGNSHGIPVMLTALGCDLNHYIKLPLRRTSIQRSLLQSDRVTVLSSQMFDTCLSLGVAPDHLKIIPNGVDLDRFSIGSKEASRQKLNLDTKSRVVIFVGSLVEVKNVASLIKAFQLVAKSDHQARLVIAGCGHLQNDLVRLAASLDLEKSVSFVGQVGHEQLVTFMNAADCLCLPSIREGHPNVMMEALACGIPVLASNIGSIPDFINDDNGLLIDNPRDQAEIAHKLSLCLSKTYSPGTVRNSVTDYSWSQCARKYLSELSEISCIRRSKRTGEIG